MSAEAVIRFLVMEFVLAVVMIIAVWGISKLDIDAVLKKYASLLVYVVIGAVMLIVLLRFAGIS